MIAHIIILVLVNILLLAKVEGTSEMIPDTITFSELVQTKLYVDKTGLLIDFISGAVDKAVYVAAPRRFGKTINNQMIKDFFNVSFEEDGYTLIPDKTKDPRYQKFKTMTHLKVVQNEKFFEEHFGNYIVVYIVLSEFHHESEETLKLSLVESFVQYGFEPFDKWFRSSSGGKAKICESNWVCCKYLTDIYSGKYDKISLWSKAFSCLFHNLKQHYHKEVILIVDEFDKSIIDSLRYLNTESAEHIMRFLGTTFGSLTKVLLPQNTEYPVFRALFTGITHLPIGPGSAQMTNVEVYSYYERHALSKYYGFDQIEVDLLLEGYNLQDKKDELKEFYDGYKIIDADWQNYNPLSIIKFFKSKGKIKSYWRTTNSVSRWFQFCHDAEVFQNIEQLALGHNITIQLELAEQVKDLHTMKDVLYICESPTNELKPQINIGYHHRKYFFKYLLQEGYLSPADPSSINDLFVAPNAEIRQEFSLVYSEYASRIITVNLMGVANVFWSIANTGLINEKFINELSDNFNRLVHNRIQNVDDYHYNEQALRSMVYFSCAHKSLSSKDQFVFAEIQVKYEAFINIKWSDTHTIRYGLDNKKYGKADVYLKLNNGETIVIIEFKMDTNVNAATKQVLGYRPRLKDQGKCKKLVLVWVVVSPCRIQNDHKTPLQTKLEANIRVSVGCYVIENYDPKNPVARKCEDPKDLIPPRTIPQKFFLKPIPV